VPQSGQEAALPSAAATDDPTTDREEQRMRDRVHARLFGSAASDTTRIGRFIVLDKLGTGGLGIVYAAHDPQLDRRVALKILRTDGRAPDRSDRLLREAQVLAQLNHPNVVVVYEAGLAADELFIAMELVDGVTLNRWAVQRERSWAEIRDVVVDAGRGLAAAHTRGVVHRDFKPGNVLVAADGRAKVVDFGLASGLGPRTTADGFAGTPPYMAPELWSGGTVDARADQWALCVTMWELSYGARPFVGTDLATLRTAVLAGNLPARPIGSKVPRFVHDALLRGLKVDPAERHRDVDALLVALTRDRRSRRRAWLAAGGLAVTLAGTAWVATAIERARLEDEVRARIGELEHEARAAADARRWIYPPADGTAPTAYERVVALEQLAGGRSKAAHARADVLRDEFATELVALADALWDEPGGRGFAMDFYAAARLFDPANAHAVERSSLTPGQLADLQAKASEGGFSPQELVAAEPLVALATPDAATRRDRVAQLVRDRDAIGDHTRRQLEALVPVVATPPPTTIAAAPTSTDTPSSARDTAPSAAKSPRDRAAAESLTKQGYAALERDQLDEAAKLFHRALGENPGHAGALAGLSEVHFERGSYHRALEYATKAVDAAPKNGRYRKLLADVYVRVVRYPEAERAYESALERGYEPARPALERLRARVGKSE
jgi:tetratricopeptide (TPR) repeat protein/predicted Ser/Thr protein kinase